MSLVPLFLGLSAAVVSAALVARDPRKKLRAPQWARYAAAAGTLAFTAIPLVVALWPRVPIAAGTVEKIGDSLELPPGAAGARQLVVRADLASRTDDLVTVHIDGTVPPVVARFEHVSKDKTKRGAVHGRVSMVRQDVLVPAGTSALILARIDGEPRRVHVQLVPRRPFEDGPTIAAASAIFLAVVILAARGGLREATIPIVGASLGFALVVHGVTASAGRALLSGVIWGVTSGLLLGIVVGWLALRSLRAHAERPRRRRP